MDLGLFLALALQHLPAAHREPAMPMITQKRSDGTVVIKAIIVLANRRLDSVSTVSRKAGSR